MPQVSANAKGMTVFVPALGLETRLRLDDLPGVRAFCSGGVVLLLPESHLDELQAGWAGFCFGFAGWAACRACSLTWAWLLPATV